MTKTIDTETFKKLEHYILERISDLGLELMSMVDPRVSAGVAGKVFETKRDIRQAIGSVAVNAKERVEVDIPNYDPGQAIGQTAKPETLTNRIASKAPNAKQ